MASEEDNFDIDIYGDGDEEVGGANNQGPSHEGDGEYEDDGPHFITDQDEPEPEPAAEMVDATEPTERPTGSSSSPAPRIDHVDDSARKDDDVPGAAAPAPPQGVKRKESSDDRTVDHGATNALMISDLHWWTTEDDVRGWAHDAAAEDELRELTFSEHKVNGKSKGQLYLEFASPQAATAFKRAVDGISVHQGAGRKHSIVFTNATQNPFKTLPKDAPTRVRDDRPVRSGGFNSGPRGDSNYGAGHQGFRGGRGGGGFGRGGYNAQNSYNRNYPGSMGGYGNVGNMGFQGNMGMGGGYGGFNRGAMMGNPMRGNMPGMRGGRGGMNNMMAMGGGMGMGPNMAMNPLMAGMGMAGFQSNQFNPAMFNAGPGPNYSDTDWNQQGAKRQRQE